jgi:hypothetical protein
MLLFIGSSPIRQYAEDWTLDYLLSAAPRRRSSSPSRKASR